MLCIQGVRGLPGYNYINDSQRPHCSCHLANNVEYIDLCPSISFQKSPFALVDLYSRLMQGFLGQQESAL